jgi:curved DNA-binding protein CbpA
VTLYDDLGVAKDASDDEIKKVFRKKAQKYHPDKPGGDAKKFQIISLAYNTLGDKAKRARYDSGEVEPPSIRLMAMQNLAQMLQRLIASGQDLDRLDVVKNLREQCKVGKNKANGIIATIKKDLVRLRRAEKRLKFKGKESPLANAIKGVIDAAEQQLIGNEQMLELGKEMESILADHEWEVEASKTESSYSPFNLSDWRNV